MIERNSGLEQKPPAHAGRMAREWMAEQTARLGITEEEILAAVKRDRFSLHRPGKGSRQR